MNMNELDPFLSYYHREISYLRKAGKIFASQHPKIARRLELSDGESPDPHVERMLESFAFMTARISKEIDDRLPQLASALLEVLYPTLVQPIPSMAIAHFQSASGKGKMTSGYDIQRHAPLSTSAEEGITCRFRTAYPVTLWPISVESVDIIPSENFKVTNGIKNTGLYLRLRLKAIDLTFADLDMDRLVFHINGDNILKYTLYEAIFAQTHTQVLCSLDGQTAQLLSKDSLRAVGFDRDESMLPLPEFSHPAYLLLQEYVHFPDKFLFFETRNLEFKNGGETVELLIGLASDKDLSTLDITPDNFLLGCTPIVNLFPKITDPLRLTQLQHQYRLVADFRRERTTEIYSIEKVSSAQDDNPDSVVLTPYFSFSHGQPSQDPTLFWLGRRVPAERKDIPGTDIMLSFVDLNFDPKTPPINTIYAHTLCTNRYLPEQLPNSAELHLEEAAHTSWIICLNKPTSPTYTPKDGETLWRLISQLSVNHLSVTAGPAALEALKETLRLYARGSAHYLHNEIEGIEGIFSEPVVKRIGSQAWRGFVQGLAITLTLNERAFVGSSAFLMTAVLRHFFALQIPMNSFVELRLHSSQRQGEWMRWQPLLGDQMTL